MRSPEQLAAVAYAGLGYRILPLHHPPLLEGMRVVVAVRQSGLIRHHT
jgi:hypothetical protein